MEGGCVFCDRSKFEERLIAENEAFYYIATLGQITNGGYVLLVPKRHVLCVGAMEESEIGFLASAVGKINSALLAEYGTSGIFFEHGVVGQTIKHAHVHFVPEECYITAKIMLDFPNSKTTVIGAWSDLRSLYAERHEPYLLWGDRDTATKICWNPAAPLQYLRIVVAEKFGRPERANWRNMDPELDKRLWTETVSRMKKYF